MLPTNLRVSRFSPFVFHFFQCRDRYHDLRKCVPDKSIILLYFIIGFHCASPTARRGVPHGAARHFFTPRTLSWHWHVPVVTLFILLRGTLVKRTYGGYKNLYIHLFY